MGEETFYGRLEALAKEPDPNVLGVLTVCPPDEEQQRSGVVPLNYQMVGSGGKDGYQILASEEPYYRYLVLRLSMEVPGDPDVRAAFFRVALEWNPVHRFVSWGLDTGPPDPPRLVGCVRLPWEAVVREGLNNLCWHLAGLVCVLQSRIRDIESLQAWA